MEGLGAERHGSDRVLATGRSCFQHSRIDSSFLPLTPFASYSSLTLMQHINKYVEREVRWGGAPGSSA